MAILGGQFTKALEKIEPSSEDKANAPEAHAAVRAVLTSDNSLKEWGINPVLIGSYRRDVSIRRVNDVDVFCRMTDIDSEVEASVVLDKFHLVLAAEFGSDKVARQARSIKVEFPEYDDLHVDAVPARERSDGSWEIPTRDGDWKRTNPERLTELKTEMNDEYDGNYVRLVKLVRQTRRTILTSRPGGLFVELALYDACLMSKVSKDSLTLGYVTALEAIADYLDEKVSWGKSLPDPSLPGYSLSFRATEKQWESARDSFRSAATKAREAYVEEDAGKAAVKFRSLLGKNGDDELVFPMPPNYNEDGTVKESAAFITPGAPKVPAGDRRFG